jgi:hypothetical protein
MTPITTTEAAKVCRSGLGDGSLGAGCEGVSIQCSTGFYAGPNPLRPRVSPPALSDF